MYCSTIAIYIVVSIWLMQSSNSFAIGTRDISKVYSKGQSGIGNSDYFNDVRQNDGYVFRFELVDGTVRSEEGNYVIDENGKRDFIVNGYYSYKLANQKFLTVYYTADITGYHIISSSTSLTRPHIPREGIFGKALSLSPNGPLRV